MAMGRVSGQRLQADARPRVACDALSQAVGAPAPSRSSRGRHRGIQKNFPETLANIACEQGVNVAEIEVWFGDEARFGQKNKITRRWARRGTRPSAPRDLRTASTYIFGAICPAQGKAVGLILPWCNTEAMNLQLAAISAKVAPGRHAALLLDQAAWHTTPQLTVPANISIVPLPAKCPELNAQENVWQFLRENWLSNRIFTCYDPSLTVPWKNNWHFKCL